MQQRLFDIGWSDESECQACHKVEGTEKHRLCQCSEWYETRREIPESFRKWEQKAKTSKKEWKWQRGLVAHPLRESQWNRGHCSMQKWESEKHKSWSMPAEGFKGQVATDGFLLCSAGKWGACGWAVVQLDHDEEMGPLHGMYASMEAEFEVQCTIKRAELTAFTCLLKRVIRLIKVDVDNKGIIDGLWRGERRCIDPKAGDADLWISSWEELHLLVSKKCWGKWSTSRRTAKRCRNLRSLSPMAKRKRMSWRRQVRLWTKDLWRKPEQRQSSRSEKRWMQLCIPVSSQESYWTHQSAC